MAVTEIPWGDGSSDKIYLTYSALEGDQTVLVSSDANAGASARSKVVTFTTTVGNVTQTLTISQEPGVVVQTLTVNFYALDADHEYKSITTPEDAYKGTGSSSTYAGILPTTGNNAETYYYFKFDTSSIPANAQIISVSCSVRNWATSGFVTNNRFTEAYMTMTSGTTEKGTPINILTNYSNAVRTFDAGTWTRAELNDVRVKFYAIRGTTNPTTDYQMRVYGGTLTVQYTVPVETPITVITYNDTAITHNDTAIGYE